MRTMIVLACVTLGSAVDVPTPSPRDTDPVTRRRAEEALAAHVADAAKPASTADVGLLDRYAAADSVILEGEVMFAKQLATQAGERYLAAAEKLKAFTAEERQALGERWPRLQAAFTALGRKLADSDGLEKAAAAAAVAPETAR